MSQKLVKIEQVYFSYDDLNILGVLKEIIYVKGYYYDNTDERINCILGFTKSLFKDTINLWLKDKEEYCERYNHFCGAMGSIICINFTITNQEIKYYDEVLPVIIVNTIENTCNMEHG